MNNKDSSLYKHLKIQKAMSQKNIGVRPVSVPVLGGICKGVSY